MAGSTYDVLCLNEVTDPNRLQVPQSGDIYNMPEAVQMLKTLDVTGNVTMGGTLALTGNMTAGGSMDVTGDMTLSAGLTLGGTKRTTWDYQLDGGTATSATGTTLTDTTKAWEVNIYAGKAIKITSGTGAGQVRSIASNTATVITVGTAFTTNPDASSVYEIVANTLLPVVVASAYLRGKADLSGWETRTPAQVLADIYSAYGTYETAKIAAFNIANADKGAVIPVNAAALTGTLQTDAKTAGWFCYVNNIYTENCIIDANTVAGSAIAGANTITIAPNATKRIYWDGAAFQYDLIDAQPFDVSTATADVSLEIGQEWYLTLAGAASYPLNLAVADDQAYDYELNVEATGGINLQPNNTTYANQFNYGYSLDGAFSSGGFIQGSLALYYLASSLTQVITGGSIQINSANKGVRFQGCHIASSAIHSVEGGSQWSNTSAGAWTSLGTLYNGLALTGFISGRRIK